MDSNWTWKKTEIEEHQNRKRIQNTTNFMADGL